jgi:hypothetical protein
MSWGRHPRWQAAIVFVAVWAAIAYLVAPGLWELAMHRRPDLAQAQHLTSTSDRHPGDPVNVVLIGSETDLVHAMQGTGWAPADPVTLQTSLRIARSTRLRVQSERLAQRVNLYLALRGGFDVPTMEPVAAQGSRGGPRLHSRVSGSPLRWVNEHIGSSD